MIKFLLLLSFIFAFGQNKNINQLDPITNAEIVNADAMIIYDQSVAETKKVLMSELALRWLSHSFTTATATTGIVLDNAAYLEFQESSGSGDNYVRLKAPASLSSNLTFNLPDSYGTDTYFLQTDGAGGLTWAAGGGGNVFSDLEITDHILLRDESYIEFRENVGSGDNYIRLKAPTTLTTDYEYELPSTYGTNGFVLESDGAGGLEWVEQTGPVTSVFARTGDVVAASGDYTASEVDFTPYGGIAATDTQSAIQELDDEKLDLTGGELTGDLSLDNESEVQFQEATANGDNYVALKAPATLSGDVTFTLPDADGSSGEALVTNGSGELSFTNVGFPVGATIMWPADSAPGGWLLCNGDAVSRTTYSGLFSVIGTTHGEGDGSTTFNLPDYRGRFIRGVDNGAGRDPNAGARTSMNTGGNTGDNVGSLQGDETAVNSLSTTTTGSSHGHNVALYYADFGQPSAEYFRGSDNQGSTNTRSTGTSGSTHTHGLNGGSETRPINAYTNFIIKY